MNNKIGEMERTEKGQSGQLEDTHGGAFWPQTREVCMVLKLYKKLQR